MLTAWQCEQWNALPEAGGIYDQDAALMYRMGVLTGIYRTVSKVRNMQGDQIHRLTAGERRLIRRLRDERLM